MSKLNARSNRGRVLILRIGVVFASSSFVAAAQTKQPSIQQQAESSICSNVVALTGNVTLNCSNLTPQQEKMLAEIPMILKAALADQNYLKAILTKLDEFKVQSSTVVNAPTCPNGICPTAPNYGTQTVVNESAPRRHISESQKSDLVACLSRQTGTVRIYAISGDVESFGLAQDWLDVFAQARWKVDLGGIAFMFGTGSFSGTRIGVSGSYDGSNPKYDPNSAGGAVAACLIGKQIGQPSDGPGGIALYPDLAPDTVSVMVGPHP